MAGIDQGVEESHNSDLHYPTVIFKLVTNPSLGKRLLVSDEQQLQRIALALQSGYFWLPQRNCLDSQCLIVGIKRHIRPLHA